MPNSPYRIYSLVQPIELDRYQDLLAPPYTVNWQTDLTQSLHKQTFVVKGERRSSVYYKYFQEDTQTYDHKILRVDYTFVRDENGLVQKRIKVISWVRQDGSWGDATKTEISHVSDPREKLREIKIRRSNIIDELKGLGKLFGLGDKITPFFEKYSIEADQFVEGGSRLLRDAIAQSDEAWLDEVIPATGNTPREVFYDYFSV